MAELLKNLYNEKYIDLLIEHLNINKKEFKKKIFDESWSKRELKERMRHISIVLGKFLPKKYDEAIDSLKIIFLKMPIEMGLENMVFQDFVEVYGLEHFEKSMKALEFFTKESSSEFAIRKFIIKYQDKTMTQMKIWANSKNLHVRRLASEGCRPRLPWAIALLEFKKNPKEVMKILEILKDDKSEYVRRSVANNLNDISKDNPSFIKTITRKWIGKNNNRDRLLKHGCRTLLKSGDVQTHRFFGYSDAKHLQIENFKLPFHVKKNEKLNFSFQLKSDKNLGKLKVEYSMFFIKKNGIHNKKVFKICEGEYAFKSKTISKSYSFKPISTRVYYIGKHFIEIVVNGEPVVKKEFNYA